MAFEPGSHDGPYDAADAVGALDCAELLRRPGQAEQPWRERGEVCPSILLRRDPDSGLVSKTHGCLEATPIISSAFDKNRRRSGELFALW